MLLVSIPLLFEVTLIGMMLDLQNKVELESQKIARSKKISDTVNAIIRDMVVIGGNIRAFYIRRGKTSLVASKLAEIRDYFDDLDGLTSDRPDLHKVVLASRAGLIDCDRDLRSFRAQYRTVDTAEKLSIVLQAIRRRLDTDLELVMSAGFLDLAQQSYLDSQIDSTLKYREQIRILLMVALGVSGLLALSGALVFSKRMAGRLSIVETNAKRLANRQPLLQVMEGADEIAELDQTFHLAANLIDAAMRKEKAILDNAKDIICSLDDKMMIVSVNAACDATLGLSPLDLIGKSFISLLKPEEQAEVTDYLKTLKEQQASKPLNITIPNTHDAIERIMSMSASYASVEETFYCVLHDVTANKEVELIRQEVTAMISHDLKAPLQSIKNYLRMLHAGRLGELNEEGTKLLQLTETESERMARLINSVLDLEKVRSGTAELNMTQMSVYELLSECCQSVKLLAGEKNICLEIVASERTKVYGDRHWLNEIFVNLLGNAIEYSPSGTTVRASGAQVDGFIEMRVSDQGPGIAEEERTLIFERFRRLSNSVGGTGLGLTICKVLVNLHKGYIRAEGNEPNGTSFVVGIPAAQPEPISPAEEPLLSNAEE
jgi:PAS domain S-box-containing protein